MEEVFGYLVEGRTGMRVHGDGAVDLRHGGADWRRIAVLEPEALGELRAAVEAAGVPALPPRTPRPDELDGGDTVELWASGRAPATIEAWADENPAAVPTRELVMTLSRLVTAAQAR